MILSASRKRCHQAKRSRSFQEVGQKRKMVLKIEFTCFPVCKMFPFKKGFKKYEKCLIVGDSDHQQRFSDPFLRNSERDIWNI